MARDEMREAGPLAVMLYPIIAIGTLGRGLSRQPRKAPPFL